MEASKEAVVKLPLHFRHRAIGPCPIHEVVVMAVRKAVRAATITFTATSTIRFVFITPHPSSVHRTA